MFTLILSHFGRGGAWDRLIALLQFASDWHDCRAFVVWAGTVDEVLLQCGQSEEIIADALTRAGPPDRGWGGRSRLGSGNEVCWSCIEDSPDFRRVQTFSPVLPGAKPRSKGRSDWLHQFDWRRNSKLSVSPRTR